jgi:hypothetical protein
LISEDQWLDLYPGRVNLQIKIPDIGGEDSWGLNGQIINLSLDPHTRVFEAKEELSSYLGGMPASKMKFKAIGHNALKDQLSLAHYNFHETSLVELQIKERGGRTK